MRYAEAVYNLEIELATGKLAEIGQALDDK